MKKGYEIMHYQYQDKIRRGSSWLFGLFRLFLEVRPDYFVISRDHFEFSLQFLEEKTEDITWPRRDTKFLFECSKTFQEWALLSNCFMTNLKVQNAAQRRGGHEGWRYCSIELFFKRYLGNFHFNVWYCGIILPCGMRFFILLADGIR